MEIEEGDYIRTKDGLIRKVLELFPSDNGKYICGTTDKYMTFTIGKKGASSEIKVVKHSKNIIDLIEEGDFVNGHKFVGKVKLGTHEMLEVEEQALTGKCFIEFNEVETILTHEQYESNCYRVER